MEEGREERDEERILIHKKDHPREKTRDLVVVQLLRVGETESKGMDGSFDATINSNSHSTEKGWG